MDRKTFVRLVLIPGLVAVALFLAFFWLVSHVLMPQLAPPVGFFIAIFVVMITFAGILKLMGSDRRRRSRVRRHSEHGAWSSH